MISTPWRRARRSAVVLAALLTSPAFLAAQGPSAAPAPRDTIKSDTGRLVETVGPIVSPLLIYSPETGYGGGAGLVWVRAGEAPGQRPTLYQTSFLATETSQFSFVGNIDHWTEGNTNRLTAELTVQRAPTKFFGIGPYATIDPPEKFVPSTVRLILTGQHRVASKFFIGLRYYFDVTQLGDVKAGPIKNGTVPGAPNGWYVSTLSALAVYDTRDRYYFPLNGAFVTAQFGRADPIIGSELNYWRGVLDARWYQSLGGQHVLALQWFADGVAGGLPPFERLPRLGGKDLVRGFFTGQFRDKYATSFTAEYRSAPWFGSDAGWQWWRLSGVAFLSTGSVAGQLSKFAAPAFQVAGGVGLRIALTRPDRLNLRIDRGWGAHSAATYFTVGEAF
ncbi:MAG: BamA/TamA family outer membrane protein [Gemmatimonadetes bacterium]|nr:BamA/TamA family outer membrane protein [Gemmatimonadota bacterium]